MEILAIKALAFLPSAIACSQALCLLQLYNHDVINQASGTVQKISKKHHQDEPSYLLPRP